MAASVGLKLFRPYRVWLVFNALTVVLIVIAGLGIIRISKSENQKLVERQLDTLVRSRITDLEHREYRSFIEGIGKEFTSLFASIDDHGFSFQSGRLSDSSVCAQTPFNNSTGGDGIIIKICRPYHSPIIPLAVLIGAFIILSAISLRFITSLEHSTFNVLAEFIENSGVIVDASQGLMGILEKIKNITKQLGEARQKEVEMARAEALAKTASQVVHDIRSPLSSMKTALEFFGKLQNPNRQYGDYLNLLELSSKRLSAIADGLLQGHQHSKVQATSFSPHKILDELAGEYQNQNSFKNIQFIKKYHLQDFNLWGEPTKLQRAFGNIIKNAVEAMDGKGTIAIATNLENGTAIISIADTGPGVNPNKLQKVLQGGYTEGKEEGHGIGMTVVRETILEYGGTLEGNSTEGQGTTFIIKIPLSKKQSTSVQKMILHSFPKEPVVIIDDDSSMREQWRLILKQEGKEVILCASYEDFVRQKVTPHISKTAVVDYHFDNSELTGVEIIRKLKENGFQNFYLCTAEYWKPSIQKMAIELNVSLCPKPLPKINIQVKPEQIETPVALKGGYQVLVIDDDQSILLCWEVSQKKFNIEKLYTFSNLESLLQENVDLRTIDIAFVDKNIDGSQHSGAEVLSYLKSKGVAKVVLASGESEEQLRRDPAFVQADFILNNKLPASFKEFFS